MTVESSPRPERRRTKRPRSDVTQLSFLKPDDIEKVLVLRRFVSDIEAIYATNAGRPVEDALTVRSPSDAYNFLRGMEALEQEQLRTVHLDTRNRIIGTKMIYQGSLNSASIRIGEVFRYALMDNACSIIVAHNHPSGDSSPSPEDAQVTSQLVEAGKLLDVEVLDHLVIGRGTFVSLKERGLGFDGSSR